MLINWIPWNDADDATDRVDSLAKSASQILSENCEMAYSWTGDTLVIATKLSNGTTELIHCKVIAEGKIHANDHH
jgi:hypothetical protein